MARVSTGQYRIALGKWLTNSEEHCCIHDRACRGSDRLQVRNTALESGLGRVQELPDVRPVASVHLPDHCDRHSLQREQRYCESVLYQRALGLSVDIPLDRIASNAASCHQPGTRARRPIGFEALHEQLDCTS